MTSLDSAKQAAAAAWGLPVDQLKAEDVSELFPWARHHAFVFVVKVPQKRMIVVVDPDEKAVPFGEFQTVAANLASLNPILLREAISLPSGVPTEELAWTLRFLLLSPGGKVGSAHLWGEEDLRLHLWIQPSGERGEALFREHCRDPVLTQQRDGWSLDFSFFNRGGGVERWHASGDARGVREARFTPALRNGTFFFPYA
jgi:hypothetical protein